MPQYQGIWTLAQAAQLQSTQRWATDPLYRNTTLLLQADNAANGAQNNTFLDSSSNNFTITRNGNTTQGSFTPYSLQPGAWSNYFEGTTSVLTLGSSADFAVGSVFTIEGWIYPTSAPNSQYVVMGTTGTSAPQVGYNGTTFAVADVGIAWVLNASTNPTVNAWNHFALCRSGTGTNQCSLFLNGVRVANGTVSAAWTTTTGLSIGNTNISTGGFPGYISNIRVVKGTDVYGVSNTTITVPTAPLTPITNTVLLTCQSNRFVDTNTQVAAKIITPSTNAVVQAFSPFAPQYQYTPSVTGGSGYFDGTGDYLSAAANTALTFGTGDFTVEGWFYANALGGQPTILNNGSDAAGLVITMFSSKIYAYFVGAGNVFGSSGATIVTNTWYHFAWVRSGSTNTFYLNGAVYGATYSSAGNHASTGGVGIGYSVAGTAFAAWNGYIANVRMVKGTAVYTGAFTPPIAPVGTSGPASSYSSTTNVNTTFTSTNTSLLTNFTNAGIVDGTMKNNLETVGNAQISTSVVKYGTGSMYFDGSLDWLTTPLISHPAYLFQSTADWTLEFWFNTGVTSGTMGLVDTYYTNSAPYSGLVVQIINGTINVYDGGSNRATTTTYANNTWQHFAWVNSNGTSRVYMNGVNVVIGGVTSWATSSNIYRANAPIQVGRDYQPAYFNGYIDDLRITRFARYTANFIPPSVALPRQ